MMIFMLTIFMMMTKPMMASLAAPERWKPPMTAWILNLLGNHYVDSGDDVDVDDGDDDECTRQRKGGRNRGNGFITELGSHWVTLAVTHRGVAISENMLSTSDQPFPVDTFDPLQSLTLQRSHTHSLTFWIFLTSWILGNTHWWVAINIIPRETILPTRS